MVRGDLWKGCVAEGWSLQEQEPSSAQQGWLITRWAKKMKLHSPPSAGGLHGRISFSRVLMLAKTKPLQGLLDPARHASTSQALQTSWGHQLGSSLAWHLLVERVVQSDNQTHQTASQSMHTQSGHNRKGGLVCAPSLCIVWGVWVMKSWHVQCWPPSSLPRALPMLHSAPLPAPTSPAPPVSLADQPIPSPGQPPQNHPRASLTTHTLEPWQAHSINPWGPLHCSHHKSLST